MDLPAFFADSKSVDLVVAHDGFLFITQICIFYSGHFDYSWTVLDATK